jgi:TATA-box binding protein (TBP) (component of TFIID and TFIIIB)
MTTIGRLGATPDLQRLFDTAPLIPYWWIGEGLLKMEFAGQRKGLCAEDILHVCTKTKKRFFNQLSVVFRLDLSTVPVPPGITPHPDRWKEVNIKLFKNGGFQMTGVSSEPMARAALNRLVASITDPLVWPNATETPTIVRFETCLINSDYALPKAIRRDQLYQILVGEYGLWSTYEPTIYQGVNTKFFWNATRPADSPPGICVCPTPCDGDGDGMSVGACKKITIAPFRTGKIIITGARQLCQLEDAYRFMNAVFTKHADHVLRDHVEEPTTTKKSVAATPPPDTAPAILRQKMRASPRGVVRLGMGSQ